MEQNNIEQNQIQPPVEGVKKQNNNIRLIVILVLIIIALVGYLIYTKVSERTRIDTNNPVTTSSDDSFDNKEITYTKEQKELITYDYEIYVENEVNGKLKDYNKTIYIDYYLFNSENEEIKNINNTILNNINNIIEENKNEGYEIKNVKNQECCYVIKEKDGKLINYQSVKSLRYIMNDNEDYIVLIEILREEYYAGGGVETKIKNIYTINKKTGNLASYNEYINTIPNLSDLKEKLVNEYHDMLDIKFDGDIDSDQITIENEKINRVNKIQNLLYKNEFTAYYLEDGDLYFEFNDPNYELDYPSWIYNKEEGWNANY